MLLPNEALVIFLTWTSTESVLHAHTRGIFITQGVPDFEYKQESLTEVKQRDWTLGNLSTSLFALLLRAVGVARSCDPWSRLLAIQPGLLLLFCINTHLK